MNKSAMQELIDKIDKNELFGSGWRDKFLEKEKRQHEKIAIDMVNICLDNTNNPDFKMEDEFNKYYNETFKND